MFLELKFLWLLKCRSQPNILISDNLQPLLCDFGLAKSGEEDNLANLSTTLKQGGSFRYMASEFFDYEQENVTFTKATDVWALAMTCVEVCLSPAIVDLATFAII